MIHIFKILLCRNFKITLLERKEIGIFCNVVNVFTPSFFINLMIKFNLLNRNIKFLKKEKY